MSAALSQVFREGAQGDPCDPLLNQTAIDADDHALRKELCASKAETPGEAVPVKKRSAFGEITIKDGQPAEPQPKRPALIIDAPRTIPRTQVQSKEPQLEGRQGHQSVPAARPGVLLVLVHDRPTLL